MNKWNYASDLLIGKIIPANALTPRSWLRKYCSCATNQASATAASRANWYTSRTGETETHLQSNTHLQSKHWSLWPRKYNSGLSDMSPGQTTAHFCSNHRRHAHVQHRLMLVAPFSTSGTLVCEMKYNAQIPCFLPIMGREQGRGMGGRGRFSIQERIISQKAGTKTQVTASVFPKVTSRPKWSILKLGNLATLPYNELEEHHVSHRPLWYFCPHASLNKTITTILSLCESSHLIAHTSDLPNTLTMHKQLCYTWS